MNRSLSFAFWVPMMLAAALMLTLRTPRAGRRVGIGVTSLAFIASIALLAFNTTGSLVNRASLGRFADFFGVDGLTAALLPIATGVPLAILISAPRAKLDLRSMAQLLFIGATTLGGSLASSLVGIATFFVLSPLPLLLEGRRSKSPALRRAALVLALTSVAPFAVATVASLALAIRAKVGVPFLPSAIAEQGALGSHEGWIGWLFIAAIAARMAIFPLHLWAPVAAERGRDSYVLPTLASPIAAVALVRIVAVMCPNALARAAPVILPLAAASAIYGAVLALGQHNAARQLAYVWTSVMGTVLAGFVSSDERGVTGALLHQLAVVLSMTGLWLHLVAVAARAGTIDLRRLGGIVRNAPGLATGHLLLGLATVAFPGTATFLSEDLVVRGLLESHPAAAGFLLVATALNGLTLVRTFKRIFLGPASLHAPDLSRVEDVQPRERWTSVALILALLAGGLAPTPLLLLRAGLRGPAPAVTAP